MSDENGLVVCDELLSIVLSVQRDFIVSHDAVSVLIPGMKTPQEVDMNIAYSDGNHLPDALLERLEKHAWARNFYT